MKKTIISMVALSATFALSAQTITQNVVDAARFSNSNPLAGTARYSAMAGAFGALGGDLSAMTNNPAGIGVYRGTTDFSFTPSLSINSTKGDGAGKNRKTDLSINNAAFVMSFGEEGMYFNLGVGLNHSEGTNRKYRLYNNNPSSSFGQYLANRGSMALVNRGCYDNPELLKSAYVLMTKGNGGYEDIPVSALMGYGAETYGGYNDSKGNYQGIFSYDEYMGYGNTQSLQVEEKSRFDEYNINFAFNYDDVFYAGVTTSITDFSNMTTSTFDEDYTNSNGCYTQYLNYLEAKGTGVNIKMGILVRPTDKWRVGLAVHTPTWMKMENIYNVDLYNEVNCNDTEGNYTPNFISSYRLFTPWQYQLSSALILGKKGLISVEYDLKDYTSMKYKHSGDTYNFGQFNNVNSAIKDYMALQHTVKVGGEYRLTSNLSLRAGYAFVTSPYKSSTFENVYRGWDNYLDDDNTIVFDSSSKPNYSLLDKQTFATAGLGYRTNSGWYFDLAVINRFYNEKVAAYPTTDSVCDMDNNGVVTQFYGEVYSDYLNLKSHLLSFDFTIGMKF